jgi:hypothetical protein
MKEAVYLLLFVLLSPFVANAQEAQTASSTSAAVADNGAASETPDRFDSVALVPSETSAGSTAGAAASASNSASAPQTQTKVLNVFRTYSFQAYGGYTFVRFYAFPSLAANRNGVDVSMSYFFRKGLFGVEGAVTGTFGSIGAETSDFAFVGGGPRVRWSAWRGLQVWGHGLVGDSHFSPQFSHLTTDGLSYELGGGVDIPSHWRRFMYRGEVDMIGSRLYSTTQYSPKVSAGIVFEF